MEAFSAEWLALREPADHAARATRLVTLVVNALATYSPPAVTVVDLGAGTGSNLRYLSRRLPFAQRWTLVDHDPRLLNKATRDWELAGESVPHNVTVRAKPADLARLDESAFAGAAAGEPQAPLLVTASALLDLTSVEWLQRLATSCRALHAVALFALTYDGRISCEPPDPADEMVRALVDRHQRTDKGFGPAAGPGAVAAAAAAFEREGYAVYRARSDWKLGAESHALQQQLVSGWGLAAAALSPADSTAITEWLVRRRAAIANGRSRIVVGHEDMVCL
jgi:hypothetical protein